MIESDSGILLSDKMNTQLLHTIMGMDLKTL